VIVPLAVSALVYTPLLRNYFVAGDFHNFYLFLNDGLLEFLIAPHGGHLLMTRNAIWWLLFQTAGMRAEVYFATVLVTHLVAVALLFAVVRRLVGSARIACVVAALWGCAPVQEGTLGWYSVYGQTLTTAILAFLLHRLAVAAQEGNLRPAAPLAWGALLLAALTSFGVGIGIALVFPIVAYLILPPSGDRRRLVGALALLALLVPPLYSGAVRLYEHLYGPSKELFFMYAGPTMPGTVLQLLVHMIGDGVVALLAEPFAGPLDYPSAVSYALAGALVVGLLVAAPRLSTRERRLVLAAWLLCVACYFLIAIGRAPFCAQGPILPIARAARYHYAATLAFALLIAVLLARIASAVHLPPVAKNAAVLAFAGALVVCHLAWGPRVDHHDAARREAGAVVAAVQQAITAAAPGSDVYITNRPFASIGPMLIARQDLFPGWAGVFIIFFPDNVVDGRAVRFVTTPQVVAANQRGFRTRSLLVTPPS
jgi:hypothetical protein